MIQKGRQMRQRYYYTRAFGIVKPQIAIFRKSDVGLSNILDSELGRRAVA